MCISAAIQLVGLVWFNFCCSNWSLTEISLVLCSNLMFDVSSIWSYEHRFQVQFVNRGQHRANFVFPSSWKMIQSVQTTFFFQWETSSYILSFFFCVQQSTCAIILQEKKWYRVSLSIDRLRSTIFFWGETPIYKLKPHTCIKSMARTGRAGHRLILGN